MPVPPIILTQFLCMLLACSLAAKWYVLPALSGRPLSVSLPPLILLHLLRPVSLWLLAPGVLVEPSIPASFATGTAYGDLLAAGLAAIAVVLVRSGSRGGVAAAWVFNVVGLLDALRNCLVGMLERAPEHMGAMVFVPAYGVPVLLVSHVLIFKLLLEDRAARRRQPASGTR